MDESAVTQPGTFSLLRWRTDATKDESKNIGVVLVGDKSMEGALKALPISAVSSRLSDQGLLDGLVEGLKARIEEGPASGELLSELHFNLRNSLLVSKPRPVAITEMTSTVDALFKAYCARRPSARSLTKGVVLDRVMQVLRKQGYTVRRGESIGGFVFDAVVQNGGPRPTALEVLSFAVPRKDWSPILHDAAHFLYALERVDIKGKAIIEPPADSSERAPYKRVRGWLRDAGVDWVAPKQLDTKQGTLLED